MNSPVVVLSADYGWTAQMEKVMKSQAFADQSKFEFMKSKRMFEVRHAFLLPHRARTYTSVGGAQINPRHPMVIELNSRVKDGNADETTKDMVISLYLSAVVGAGYQLTPEDAQDFGARVGRMVTSGLGIAADAELAPELEVADEPEEEAAEDEEGEEDEDEEDEGAATKEEL